MNRANTEKACLYNKWLTSTLNTLLPETCNCQSRTVEGANDHSKYMCFMINRSIFEDRMHDPDHRRLSNFFLGMMLVDLQIKASKIAEVPL